ncbi:MAG: cold-shock protein [Lysobacter sp.]
MERGQVLFFDTDGRGWGFITPEFGGKDVFLHRHGLAAGEGAPMSGDTVEFEVEKDGNRGLRARNVRKVHT